MKKLLKVFLLVFLISSLFMVSVNAATINYTDKDGKTQKIDDFLDTKGHWAHDVILKWADYDIVNGYNGNFNPNNPITRADFCVIIDRLVNLETVSYNFYSDLSNNAYYRDAVLKCVAAGYVNGTSSTTVSPAGYATREQVATIICRIFDIDTTTYRYVKSYNDDSKISSWAKPSVYALRRLGYMTGVGSNEFSPQRSITRGEMMKLLDNIAGVYIPKKDKTSQGSQFKTDFSSNLMTSRNLILEESTVKGDLILTRAASSITLDKSDVLGRLFVMDRSTLSLTDTEVQELYLQDGNSSVVLSSVDINKVYVKTGKVSLNLSDANIDLLYLNDGKSTVTGMAKSDVKEVYIAEGASESSLDAIPTKITLEPGVRIKIEGETYENETLKNKTYYGVEIKADISEEKGYVAGGAKVSGTKMTQVENNTVSVSGIKISKGTGTIIEVGVVWVNQKDGEIQKIPTYRNKDGYVKYLGLLEDDKTIEFDIGKVVGTRSYRVYVLDSEGLYGYSNTFTFTAYNYNIEMNVYDNNYPEKMDFEFIMQGSNLPDISSIRITYGTSEVYNESLKNITLKLYTDKTSELTPDDDTYRRYIGTITSDKDSTGEYDPPTFFGYMVTFKDGTYWNRYPVLSNVIPEGVSPVAALRPGSIGYISGNNLSVTSSLLKTRYIIPQEVGIVYKVVDTNTVETPIADVNGWKRSVSYVSVGANETVRFNNNLSVGTTSGYTLYAAYVKTSNGYWYSDVYSVSNDSAADENGYLLKSASVTVVGDNSALLTIKYSDVQGEIKSNSNIDLGVLGAYTLSDLDYRVSGGTLYVALRELSGSYSIPIRITKSTGEKSNIITVYLNANEKVDLYLSNKHFSDGNSEIRYRLKSSVDVYLFVWKDKLLTNSDANVGIIDQTEVRIPATVDIDNNELVLVFTYYGLTFTRTIPLN